MTPTLASLDSHFKLKTVKILRRGINPRRTYGAIVIDVAHESHSSPEDTAHASSPSYRRDRHERGMRGPLLPWAIPRYRTRTELFDGYTLTAYAPIQQQFAEELRGVDIAIDTVPRMRLSTDSATIPDDIVADGPVPLGRIISAGVTARGIPTRARIVLFRKPIEQRVATREELEDLISAVLVALVAQYLNIQPIDIDPDFDY